MLTRTSLSIDHALRKALVMSPMLQVAVEDAIAFSSNVQLLACGFHPRPAHVRSQMRPFFREGTKEHFTLKDFVERAERLEFVIMCDGKTSVELVVHPYFRDPETRKQKSAGEFRITIDIVDGEGDGFSLMPF